MDNMDIQGDEIIDLDEVGVHSQPTHNEIDYAAPYPPPPSPSSAQPASFAERVPSAHAAPAPAPLAQAAPPGALSAPTVPPQSEPCALSALAECSAPPVTSAPPMQDDVPTAPSAPSNVMYNQTPNINCISKINTDEALTDEHEVYTITPCIQAACNTVSAGSFKLEGGAAAHTCSDRAAADPRARAPPAVPPAGAPPAASAGAEGSPLQQLHAAPALPAHGQALAEDLQGDLTMSA
ncbi:proline-rich protein 36-like [Leguminivora glycinivorella]|uniref:proline-rich protein 36-like n=1 Tax=Leguminivora glycinivorella TaxID=1035111 RepID=UPI00201004B9|nr:proline-rich protein 36-like [Leguminivora glycinivorella]